MLRKITLLLCLAAFGRAEAQNINIVSGEYWIDTDLGWDLNTSFEITDAPDVAALQLPINMTGYAPGTHTIGIRTLDEDGKWSLTNFSKVVVIPEPPQIQDLTEMEYFLNQDPGFGNGLTAWTGSTTDLENTAFSPDLSSAVIGINTLFTRSRSTDGTWSLTNHSPILVIEPDTVGVIDRVQIFALPNADPGFGQATTYSVPSPASDLNDLAFDAPVPVDFIVSDTIMVRAHDSQGRWSLTNHVIVAGCTDVDELATKTNISVYPNPFAEQITVRPSDDQPLRVILYDPQGKLVVDRIIRSETVLDLANQASGMYTAFFWKDLKVIHRVTLVKR